MIKHFLSPPKSAPIGSRVMKWIKPLQMITRDRDRTRNKKKVTSEGFACSGRVQPPCETQKKLASSTLHASLRSPFREARAPCTSYLIGQQRPQSMPQSRTKSRTNLFEK